nr:EOG090X0G6M [Eurycercus lamellatus]
MIDVAYSNGSFLVWNVEDIYKLRTEYRIVGSYIGCLPSFPRQDQLLGLPMELLAEEVFFLTMRGAVRVVCYDELDLPPSDSVKKEGEELRKKSFLEQAALFKNERVAHIMKMAPKIIEGKKRKQGSENFDEKAALEMEIEKIPEMTEDAMLIQIFTSNSQRPYFRTNSVETDAKIKPSLRSSVFVDLWQKGYYITGGQKFGGDFLVYPGDPLKFHSHYIAVCVDEHQHLTPHFLISKGRLGTNVKKTVLICSVKDNGEINYQSLNWNGK